MERGHQMAPTENMPLVTAFRGHRAERDRNMFHVQQSPNEGLKTGHGYSGSFPEQKILSPSYGLWIINLHSVRCTLWRKGPFNKNKRWLEAQKASQMGRMLSLQQKNEKSLQQLFPMPQKPEKGPISNSILAPLTSVQDSTLSLLL